MPRVFLSHAGPDTKAARALKQALLQSAAGRAAGLEIWLDADDLSPGDGWQAEIETAMGAASACILLVGARGVVNWVRAELDLALSRAVKEPGFRLIPVLLGDARSGDLTPFARRYHAVRDPLGDPAALQSLLGALISAEGAPGTRATTSEPYRGLGSMDETWSDLFFGRDAEVADLLARLREEPVVSIVAASGSGKSSLAQAGLAAAWRGGAFGPRMRNLEDPTRWHVVTMRPETNALEGLRNGFEAAATRLDLPSEDRKNGRAADHGR